MTTRTALHNPLCHGQCVQITAASENARDLQVVANKAGQVLPMSALLGSTNKRDTCNKTRLSALHSS